MVCWHEEHSRLIERIEGRSAGAAVALMRKHLQHVEQSLKLGRANDGKFDLRAIYAPAAD